VTSHEDNLPAHGVKQTMQVGHSDITSRIREAEESGDAMALFRFGVGAAKTSDYVNGIRLIRAAIAIDNGIADFHASLGKCLISLDRYADAEHALRRSLDLDNSIVGSHICLGVALMGQNRFEEAGHVFGRALDLDGNSGEAAFYLGVVLTKQNRLSDACDAYGKAIAITPDLYEARTNLAAALVGRGLIDEAISTYRVAVARHPDRPAARAALGLHLIHRGQLKEGISLYSQLKDQIGPTNPDVGFLLGYARMMSGDLAGGWQEFETRWDRPDFHDKRQPHFSSPRWTGDPAQGRSILLWAEQGFGDTIQFMRYAPILARNGWRVFLEVPHELVRLAAKFENVTVLPRGIEVPPYDVQCPLLSVPPRLGISIDTIPSLPAYVRADDNLRGEWGRVLPTEGFKVGIAWQGNPAGDVDRGRSFPLNMFADISRIDSVRLVSLQKKYGLEQLAGWTGDIPVALLSDRYENGDFADTAAIMAELDLIITCDTSVAHLAGALGVPVWVILRVMPDWRWLMDRDDSPWYPSMRLFRQTARGDWAGVFRMVGVELRRMMGGSGIQMADPG
jgi:tetratricopeptide (TPR) repeat protein